LRSVFCFDFFFNLNFDNLNLYGELNVCDSFRRVFARVFDFCGFAFGLGWGSQIIFVLKGALPVLAVLFGIFAIFIGLADMNDRREAKLEEEEARKAEEEAKKS